MGVWERFLRFGLGRRGEAASPPASELASSHPGEQLPLDREPASGGAAPAPSRLAGWVEQRAERVVARVYESRADDLEERAKRAVSAAYERSANDLEERAVRALRRALEIEADRIREAIEHGIAVKKREVRLSLLVLVVSSLVYLALYWFTRGSPS